MVASADGQQRREAPCPCWWGQPGATGPAGGDEDGAPVAWSPWGDSMASPGSAPHLSCCLRGWLQAPIGVLLFGVEFGFWFFPPFLLDGLPDYY